MYLTATELAELSAGFQALIEPYQPGHQHGRQVDARRVCLVFRTVPAVDPPPGDR